MPILASAPIRTITLGLADPHPISSATITRASKMLHEAEIRFTDAGYEVQTVRLSTRPLFDDLAQWSTAAIFDYTKDLQKSLDDVGLRFCSLGTMQAAHPNFSLEHLNSISDILAASSALNLTVQLATDEYGLHEEVAIPVAQIMQRLARETEEGFGNFRFAMLACVAPGSPFFPSAYHDGPTSLSLGLQGASIVGKAIQSYAAYTSSGLTLLTRSVREELVAYAEPIVALGQTFAQEQTIKFGGIDLSPAPLGEDSIVAAIEHCDLERFGAPGTIAVAGAVTAALKSTNLPTCGYNGLMLPVLEDAVLGRRWEESLILVHQLLLYSAVCGTGLDTIPLAGNTPVETIAHLLLDVATLALRLQKPLSARLFPVPSKNAGERTTFTSPYLSNTLVRNLS